MREIAKPPWTAGNARERRAMIDWVIWQLERLQYVEDGRLTWLPEPDNWNADIRTVRGRPIRGFRHFAPIDSRDQKRWDNVANSALDDAVDTVPLIREIWLDEYGRKNRHANDGASAYEIAAILFDVDPAHVASRSRKPSGKRERKISLI
jgi:hypothetical protein